MGGWVGGWVGVRACVRVCVCARARMHMLVRGCVGVCVGGGGQRKAQEAVILLRLLDGTTARQAQILNTRYSDFSIENVLEH